MLKLTHILAVISIIAAHYSSFIDSDQTIKFDFLSISKQQVNAPKPQTQTLTLVKAEDEVQS
ncbi:hypothetical protein [Pseudoalteromonas tunicata]|uniref:hypothetical protein n=1 Tax=Pseudoalteromonas tunicata TaxID=314281 RepID=UPI00273F77B9|nr:hypothetical protein [Pseudoalteromonas tunicata]MDP4983646.1 hypothetical protein [Pseudoalteromonas tunicata]MDP5211745.1 hypothetical protein [Pseudoalteromonas tunicata]